VSPAAAVERADAAVWMGEIPEHWDVTRLKYVATLGTGHTPSRQHPEYWEDCTIPWVTLADVWQLRDGRQATITETAEKISELGLANSAAVLRPAGTVILSRTASVGFSAILDVDAATSQDFMTWTCGPRLEPKYLLYVLRAMKQEFRRLVMGSTHKTIYMPDIERLTIPLPPIEEQRRAVERLDRELAQIDAVFSAKQRLIGLLAEKRTSVITFATARGLKHDRPMEETGLDWPASLPVEWHLRRLRELAASGYRTFTDGDWIETPYITDEGVRLIQTGNVGIGNYREQGFRYVSDETFTALRCTEVLPGDVLICRLADPVGRACLAPDLGTKMITSVDVCILRPSTAVDRRFIVYALTNNLYLQHAGNIARGGTRDRVSRSQLGAVKVAVPPIEEQEQIANFLDDVTARIDELRRTLGRQLELLEEHRATLIFSAVTGRLEE
jgi:type I restriction enzyme S subunit